MKKIRALFIFSLFAVAGFCFALSSAHAGDLNTADNISSNDTIVLGGGMFAVAAPLLAPYLAACAWGHCREDADKRSPFKYPSPYKIHINPRVLGQCLTVAAYDATPSPFIDEMAMSCEELDTGRLHESMTSSLDYLGAQLPRACDWISGQETALKKWVLRQKDNSIDPVRIFEASLRLNRGNIWNAVLTIHQLLRVHARWSEHRRYGVEAARLSQQEVTDFFNKFVDIRGDLWELNPEKLHGDHAGSWYRIWGSMLFRLLSFNSKRISFGGAQVSAQPTPPPAPTRLQLAGKAAENLLERAIFYGDERLLKWSEGDLGKFRTDLAASRAAGHMLDDLNSYNFDVTITGKFQLPTLAECRNQIYLERDQVTYDDVPFAKPVTPKK